MLTLFKFWNLEHQASSSDKQLTMEEKAELWHHHQLDDMFDDNSLLSKQILDFGMH